MVKPPVNLAVLMLTGFLLFAACTDQGPPPRTPGTVKIGAVYPLSGPEASTGADLRAGVELAEEIINSALDLPLSFAPHAGLPNLGNATVEVIFKDSRSDPRRAADLVEELAVSDRVCAVIGCYNSTVTAAASERAEMLRIPFLNPESTSPTLTQRGLRWFFRTTPDDQSFSENFFNFLDELPERAGVFPPRRIVLVFENRLWGTSVARSERNLAARHGYEIVGEIPYDSTSTDFTEELQRLKALLPAIVMQASYEQDAIGLVQGYRRLGLMPLPLLAMDAGFISPKFLATVGTDCDLIMSREVFALDIAGRKPFINAVNRLFERRFGKTMTGNSARSFTAVLVLAQAVNLAGSMEPARIREALRNIKLPPDQLIMPWGGVSFDPDTGQNTQGSGIIVQFQDGRYQTVWPWELAAKPVIWPAADGFQGGKQR